MNENEIRNLVAEVKQGTLSRRSFIRTMATVGIAAPIASQILVWHDVAMADATLPYKPAKAGGGGTLKLLLWQAPTLLNPHFALGTKDQIASRIFFEAARRLGQGGQPHPLPRRRGSDQGERRPFGRRHERDLEAEAGRDMA